MLYEDSLIRVEIEPFEIPWIKIFAKKPCKEMSDCDERTKVALWRALEIIEVTMRELLEPDKINIASFGNYLPQVHWHIQARFMNDSFFPEPVWGAKQREGEVELELEEFYKEVTKRLEEGLCS